MYNLDITKDAVEFTLKLQAKQYKQVHSKIFGLLKDPYPSDSQQLKGYDFYRRTDIGEYRIVYRINNNSVEVAVVGKRNDDEVYKKFGRKHS